jgi:hypothetical protein
LLTEEEDDPQEVRGAASGMAEGAGAESGGKGSRANKSVGASPKGDGPGAKLPAAGERARTDDEVKNGR